MNRSMRLPMTRSESIDLIMIITHLTPSHLCLLLFVRLGGYIVNLWDFYSYYSPGNWPIFCSFSSSACSIWPWPVPLPPHGFHFTGQSVDLTLTKPADLHSTINLDGARITSKSHTHPSHSQTSRLLTSSLSLGVPVPRSTQCIQWV